MARFTKNKATETPGLNMGSMSDIIFMLLFYFMVITSMRENTLVNTQVPAGSEVASLKDANNSCTIYIGIPQDDKKYGKNPRIQVNDQLASKEKIRPFIDSKKRAANMSNKNIPNAGDQLTTIIKADKGIPMGLMSEVKLELRMAGALKIFYNAAEDHKK